MMLFADVNPYIPAPAFLNSGDTAWQLMSATLVGLMSVPGLAILYGGIVKKKWALNSAVMVFYAFAMVLITWVLWGYNMSFGNPVLFGIAKPVGALQWFFTNFIGIPGPALSPDFLIGQANIPLAGAGFPPLRMPGSAMIYFQFVFAAITPVLIAGAVLGRMNFKAWMIFVPLWSSLVYTVGAFAIWGGGWLAQLGALDYSGGYVIHVAAGVSGFVAAAVVGPRLIEDQRSFNPNNLIMAFAGAGLLWLGWNGFNGGDPYFANADAGAAVLNTNLATAVALLVWLFADMFFSVEKKPNGVSMINGMITGLVAITPAAGYVDGYGAIAIGFFGSLIPWFTFNKLGHLGFLKKVDDTLGVLHTHAIAGAVGGLMVGIVGNPLMVLYGSNDKKIPAVSVTGLIGQPWNVAASWHQLQVQAIALVCVVAWNAIATFIVLKIVSLMVPLRSSEGEMAGGDFAIHGMDPIPIPGVPVPAGALGD